MKRQELQSISPLDGRYRDKISELALYFSEQALINYRVKTEIEYLLALSEHPQIGLRSFNREEIAILRKLQDLSFEDAEAVKDLESVTNHDVKAIEYFIKQKLENSSLKDVQEWVHFAITSEDTNNIAYALMLSDSIHRTILPILRELLTALDEIARQHKGTVMLARTHGQAASPTTMGKEFKVFVGRLLRQIQELESFTVLAKLNGATGNYNAHLLAYPDVDWIKFSKDFINKLSGSFKVKLAPNILTTQIESHDTYAELFDILKRINIILIDFNQDVWRYISDGWLIQKVQGNETGSSTMPHKVNPIDFENSEGNLGIANALFIYFAAKLPVSRLQRDLSDSTVLRNIGVAFAHSLLAYKSTLKGLSKIEVNLAKISQDLENHPELIAEGIQTVLRREGVAVPYEQLKELTRGKKVSLSDFDKFIDKLEVADKVKKELKVLKPANYIGLANILN